MPEVAIFAAHSHHKPFRASTLMYEMLEKANPGHYQLVYYEDVVFELATDSAVAYLMLDDKKVLLESYQVIFLRSIVDEAIRGAIAQYCRYKGIRVINSENLDLPLLTKLSQYIAASCNGVPIPKTFFAANPDNRSLAEAFLAEFTHLLAKSITGSNGNDNILVDNISDIDLTTDYVIQGYVTNHSEYRVITIDYQPVLVYKKVRGDSASYRNNIAKGGHRELVTAVPDRVAEIASTMARLTKREIAGSDILIGDDGELTFLEVNYSYGHPQSLEEEMISVYAQKLVKFISQESEK